MIVECTRGFGRVEHPETGENINVEEPFETDRETFELLNEAYPGFEIVEDTDDAQDDESEDAEESEDETFTCGVEKGDGEPCGREVDSPDDTCWQH